MFPLYTTVYGLAFHFAYKFTVALLVLVKFLTDCLSSYTFAPSEVFAHPANVYPVLLNPFAVNALLTSYVCSDEVVLPPVFVFPLYAITYLCATQCA